MTQFELCLARVKRRARELWEAVEKKKLNESAVENLLRSYVDQPAYYPEWRESLVEYGMFLRTEASHDVR